jgi:hypothetical protein
MVAIYRHKDVKKIKGVFDGEALTKKDLEIRKELKILEYMSGKKRVTLRELQKIVAPYNAQYTIRNLLRAEVIVRLESNAYQLVEVEKVCPQRNW